MRRSGCSLLGLMFVAGLAGLAGEQVLAARALADSPAVKSGARSPVSPATSSTTSPSIASASSPATPEAAGQISFIGHNIFGSAHGVFHVWHVVEAQIDLADPAASRAVLEVSLASVDTDSQGRDDHLRTPDFFAVEKYPVATVRGHSPQRLAPGPTGRRRYAVQFDVDLHGVRKTLEGEVEIVETSPVVVEGGFTILRSAFGVGETPSRWNPMSIDDEVPVRFRVRFAE